MFVLKNQFIGRYSRLLGLGNSVFSLKAQMPWTGSAFLLLLLTQGSPSSEGLVPELHTHTRVGIERPQTFLNATVGRSVVLVATAFLEVHRLRAGALWSWVLNSLCSVECVCDALALGAAA